MDKNVKKYIQQTGIEKDPLALNMTREQIPSVLLMKDAQKFIDEIAVLVTSGKRICIIGDYDTDGVNSTSSQYRFLLLAIKYLNEKLDNPNPARLCITFLTALKMVMVSHQKLSTRFCCVIQKQMFLSPVIMVS